MSKQTNKEGKNNTGSVKNSSKLSDISGDILISDLVNTYPVVIEFLVQEYGFYCVTCFMAGYETLEQGARVHGIRGSDFVEMLDQINEIVNQS